MMQVLLEYANGKKIDATMHAALDSSAGRLKLSLDKIEGLV